MMMVDFKKEISMIKGTKKIEREVLPKIKKAEKEVMAIRTLLEHIVVADAAIATIVSVR